jgi:predicted transcriptional regulator
LAAKAEGSGIPNLASVTVFSYLEGMEIPFTADQEAQLARMATKSGTDASHWVKDAALRLLEEEARFLAAVEKGIAAAERGEFVEEEEMDARLERMFMP